MTAPVPAAHLVALASLPRMGPRRFQALLVEHDPESAWRAVLEGRLAADRVVGATLVPDGPELLRRWRNTARTMDVAHLWDAHVRAGVRVLIPDDTSYPDVLRGDLEPPPVLFARGDLGALECPAVAVVGTRRCTQYGREVAFSLGADLASAGVSVVSGLAAGIDAAAHAGALGSSPAPSHGPPPAPPRVGSPTPSPAPVIGVVANGLDVVYPRRHRELYRAVGERGLLLSEHPLGTQPRAWAFPARNRIVAALARAVVVVESRTRGGSLYTVEEAMARDLAVMAIPGSVRSPASAGPNLLICEGCVPVRDARDVLEALGLPAPECLDRAATGGTDVGPRAPADTACSVPADPPDPTPGAEALSGDAAQVLEALGWEPASLEQVALITGLPLPRLHSALTDLEGAGLLRWEGAWIERCDQSSRARRRA